jgi:PAS domain S-box-containing protein
MAFPRSRPPATSGRTVLVRRVFFGLLVLFIGNLEAMVDAVLHPEFPYFDAEHLIVGGFTALTMVLLLAALDIYLSRRNQSELAQRSTEQRLLEAQKISRLGSYVIDVATGARTNSKVLDDILGLSNDDRRDTAGWFELVHAEERQWMVNWFTDAAAGRAGPFDREFRIVRPSDQGIRWVHGLGTVEFDQTNRPVSIVGTLQDITERKRTELERQVMHEIAQSIAARADLDDLLKLMHDSLKRVFEAENCFFALHDPKTGLFSFPYFADQYDSAPEPQAMKDSCTAYIFRRGQPVLITQEVFNRLEEQHEVVLLGAPSPSWMGVPLSTPTGTIGVLVLQHYEKVGIYDERDLRFLAEIGNQAAIVIERKQAEVALRDREAELAVILESTADGILAVDRHGKVIKTNRRFAELWRIPPALIDSGDDDALQRHVVSQLADPEEFLSKVRLLYGSAKEDWDTLRFKDGRVFERHSSPILQNGEIGGRVWSYEDITARTHAEVAAAELETQLHLAQRLESVGLLAGGVAHEFNNVLTAILGNTELALRQLDPAQQVHADLVEVHKSAQRAAELTRQLLAFARSQPVAPRVLDLNVSVPALLSILKRLIGKEIEVVLQPAVQLWPVKMDPTQMDQIVTNLVVNSRHAIAGSGVLTIATANRVIDAAYCATHAGVAPGEYVQLSVTDTGSGMDAATVSRVFEPFFTTKDVGKGTGLGLAMVYGAVKQHGGFITVSSAPGIGTTFEVHLPRHVND